MYKWEWARVGVGVYVAPFCAYCSGFVGFGSVFHCFRNLGGVREGVICTKEASHIERTRLGVRVGSITRIGTYRVGAERGICVFHVDVRFWACDALYACLLQKGASLRVFIFLVFAFVRCFHFLVPAGSVERGSGMTTSQEVAQIRSSGCTCCG